MNAIQRIMGLKNNIRALRQERGLTLSQLAGQVGMSTPHLSEIERGVKNLNNQHMERLSKALRGQPYELITEKGDTNSDRLRVIAQELPAEDQARLLDFAKALLTLSKAKQPR